MMSSFVLIITSITAVNSISNCLPIDPAINRPNANSKPWSTVAQAGKLNVYYADMCWGKCMEKTGSTWKDDEEHHDSAASCAESGRVPTNVKVKQKQTQETGCTYKFNLVTHHGYRAKCAALGYRELYRLYNSNNQVQHWNAYGNCEGKTGDWHMAPKSAHKSKQTKSMAALLKKSPVGKDYALCTTTCAVALGTCNSFNNANSEGFVVTAINDKNEVRPCVSSHVPHKPVGISRVCRRVAKRVVVTPEFNFGHRRDSTKLAVREYENLLADYEYDVAVEEAREERALRLLKQEKKDVLEAKMVINKKNKVKKQYY